MSSQFLRLPSFAGSTGTDFLSAATLEEHYIMTWTAASAQVIELPTGGSAYMNEGANLMYASKKEQSLALARHLRTLFRIGDIKLFRVLCNIRDKNYTRYSKNN